MSRAINLSLSETEVTLLCKKAGVDISAIEPLPRGGTRLVCMTNDGAAKLRMSCKSDVMEGPQKRMPFFVPALQRQ